MTSQIEFWSDLLSQSQYDGIIGISQGAAMAALLLAMVSLIEHERLHWLM